MKTILFLLFFISFHCQGQSVCIYKKDKISIFDDLTDTGRCCIVINGSYKYVLNLDKQHMIWKNEIDFVWINSDYACLHIFSDQSLQSLLFMPLSNKYKAQYFSSDKRSVISADSLNNNVCYIGSYLSDKTEIAFKNLISGRRKAIYIKDTECFPSLEDLIWTHDKVLVKCGSKTLSVNIKNIY